MKARRLTAATTLLIVIVSTTASCAGVASYPEAFPDESEAVSEWMAAWVAEHGDTPGSVTTMSGQAADSAETEVTAELGGSKSIASFRFSCFGEGTLRFAVSVRQGSSFVGVETDALPCEDSPHDVAATSLGISPAPVTEVTMRAFDASIPTAWGVVARP